MIIFEGLLRKYKLSLLLTDVIFDKVESELIEYLNFRCETYYKNFITGSDIDVHKLITFSKASFILHSNNINSCDQLLYTINEWYEYFKSIKKI